MRAQRTRVKVCGVTNPEDAAAAVLAGADAVGVVLAESPRRVTLDEAAEAFAVLPPLVSRVAVFVDAPPGEVSEAVDRLGLDLVQFHGGETPERCASSPVPVVKAFRVGTGFAHASLEPYRGSVAAVLLDTYDPQRHGGTGKTIAWHTLTRIPGGAPVFLAGGLTPANVGEAVRAVRPYAVDVSSGVEERPRHKDRLKLRAFVAAVRAADEEADR